MADAAILPVNDDSAEDGVISTCVVPLAIDIVQDAPASWSWPLVVFSAAILLLGLLLL